MVISPGDGRPLEELLTWITALGEAGAPGLLLRESGRPPKDVSAAFSRARGSFPFVSVHERCGIPRTEADQAHATHLGSGSKPDRSMPFGQSCHTSDQLEQAFGAIKDEFLKAHSLPRFGPHPQKLVDTGKWDAFHFYTYGRRIDQNHAACLQTSKVIDSIDGTDSAGIVYFSVLHDGTHIRAHNGVTNTRVRCQLCLAAAEKGCEIRVDSETRSWVPGKCMIFDDSFEHEAWNHSGAERVVLIVDLWHPELTPCERQAVAMINTMFDSYEKFRRQVQDRLREAEAFPAGPDLGLLSPTSARSCK